MNQFEIPLCDFADERSRERVASIGFSNCTPQREPVFRQLDLRKLVSAWKRKNAVMDTLEQFVFTLSVCVCYQIAHRFKDLIRQPVCNLTRGLLAPTY